MTMLAERCLEKYAKKLLGKTEIEDALKKLDRLTQEEARMAAAENMKLTHTVDKRVEAVADTVGAIDNRLARVDDRVADVVNQVTGVDERVAGVDGRVAGVIDQVAGIDERVAGVDDQVKQTANDVDEIKRLSSLNLDQCRLSSLTYPFREPIPGEHSQMALPTGPLYEPQHCMWYSSQETRNLVF